MNAQKIFLAIHFCVSLFFLPLILICAGTGALYVAGIRSTETTEIFDFPQIAHGDFSAARRALAEKGVALPQGEICETRKGAMLGDVLETHVVFSDNAAGGLRASVVTPGIFDKFLLIHKGKAGTYFSVLEIAAAVALFVAYISGILFAFKNKSRRGKLLISLVLGVLALAAGFVFA